MIDVRLYLCFIIMTVIHTRESNTYKALSCLYRLTHKFTDNPPETPAIVFVINFLIAAVKRCGMHKKKLDIS